MDILKKLLFLFFIRLLLQPNTAETDMFLIYRVDKQGIKQV